jgi:hypothetical protein
MARKLLANLGLAFVLGVAAAPSTAQEAGDSINVPGTRSQVNATTGQEPAVGNGGSRAVSINRRREAELRRLDAERDDRELDGRLLDAERRARDNRGNADSRLMQAERNTLRRNESAVDRELRLRNLRDETRRVDSERWQVEDLERQIKSGRHRLGRSRPVGGPLR